MEEYRRVVGRFATGVAIVSTVQDGVDHAMTVSAFTSVSLDPLLVLFCPEKIARFHDAVLRSGLWAVSILGEQSKEASQRFATRGRELEAQLTGWKVQRGEHTGAPIFAEAIGALECRTRAVHDGGDHSIVVGEVLGFGVPNEDGGPLIYYRGGYWRLGPPA